MTPFAIKITIVKLICWKFCGVWRVFSTGKLALIRVPQYWIIGVKGGCKGTEYSKVLKKPLSSSTGIVSDTLIYHNACNFPFDNLWKIGNLHLSSQFLYFAEKNGKFVCQNLKFTEIQNYYNYSFISLTVSAVRQTVVLKSVVVGGCPAGFD